MEADHHARSLILQSFGITDRFRGRFCDIFHLFPYTPVKPLRDICKTLQLYDLVDLIENAILHFTKSLRPSLTLDEVRKLGKIDGRPISFHTAAAVLIFADSEDDFNAKNYESFFKSLNIKNEVTITPCGDVLKLEKKSSNIHVRLRKADMKFRQMDYQLFSMNQLFSMKVTSESQQSKIMELASEVQMQRQTVEQLEKELKEIEKKEEKVKENVETAASTVIDRWIQRQG